MTTGPAVDWKENLARLAPAFAERAAAYDDTDAFVAENHVLRRSPRGRAYPEKKSSGERCNARRMKT